MKSIRPIFPEIRREWRWMLTSSTAVVLLLAAVTFATLSTMASVSSATAAVDQFNLTLNAYRTDGESVEDAIRAPSTVTSSIGKQIISNSLRYDLESATAAKTQLHGAGAVNAAISASAFVFFPLVGYILGVFLATHDVKSGSITFRWPRSGLRPFWASKLVVGCTAMAILTALTALLAWVATLGAAIWKAPFHEYSDVVVFQAPSLATTGLLLVLASFIGCVFLALGFLLGSVTRERTFTVAAFAIAYYLLPIFSALDPRNLMPMSGIGTFYFVGQFQPSAIGGGNVGLGIAGLAALALLCAALSILAWKFRSRVAGRL